MTIVAEQLIAAPTWATEPALACLTGDEALLGCVEPATGAAGRDRVVVRRLRRAGAGWEASAPPLALEAPGHAAWPEVAATPDGGAWIAFLDVGEDGPRGACTLRLRRLEAPQVDVAAEEAPSLRHPRLLALPDGGAALAWVTLDDAGHGIEAARYDAAGACRARWRLASSPRGLALARPDLCLAPGGGLLAVWEAHRVGRIALDAALLETLDPGAAPTSWTLLEAPGFLQHPRLAAGADGALWMAYASDVPAGPPPGLPRWVQVVALRPGAGAAPWVASAPRTLPGMDLSAQGEDQSLEFPALVVRPGGGLVIAARASHNARLFTVGPGEEAAAWDLCPVLWGCRGIRMGLALDARGEAVVAFHDRRGIMVRAAALAADGAPAAPPPGPPLAPPPGPRQALVPARPAWGGRLPYMGDIHFHSAHSDGVGTLEEALLRARDRYGYDFACLTDHDAFLGRRVTRGVWRAMRDASEAIHAPSEGFAALIGIEYTGPRYPGPGHRCVYLPDGEAPLICRADGLEDPAALLERVREAGGIAVPHHVGWIGGDPEHHDPEVQPCWEICSAHGQYECEADDVSPPPLGQRPCLPQDREALAQHYLRRQLEGGARFGFVGGSDGHGLLWHHGISPRADSHRTGLTGVWAPHLGRAEVLAALRARQTWATTGEPILLAMEADGAPMGAALAAAPRQVRVGVQPTAACVRLELFAPGADGRTRVVVARALTLDIHSFDWILFDICDLLPASGFLYARLTQEDGGLAWGSPVFW